VIKMLNKFGRQKILSAWWFFVLAVIGGGIVTGVWIYYSTGINSNNLEADILSSKLLNCVKENMNELTLNRNFEIFNECNLNRGVFEKPSNFYFRVFVFKEDELVSEIKKGDFSFEKDCFIEENVVAIRFPKCSVKKQSFVFNNENYEIFVLAGVNQQGGRLDF